MSLGSCSSKGRFLFMSLFPCPCEVSPLVPPVPCHGVLPCHKPKSKRTKQLWAETSEILSQNSLPFFWLSKLSCDSKGKVTGIYRMLRYLTDMTIPPPELPLSLERMCGELWAGLAH